MSKFLGPIHFWLHGKIKLQEKMELAFEEQYFTAAAPDATYEDFNKQYGLPSPDEDLEQNIDTANIHGWLQAHIVRSESRFASKLTYLSKVEGDRPLQVAVDVFRSFGCHCAEEALSSGQFTGHPESAYKILNNYILEGMPCDQAGAVTQQSEDALVWQSTRCLHKAYWEAADGDRAQHYVLRDAFSSAFFKALGGFSYERVPNGDANIYSITK